MIKIRTEINKMYKRKPMETADFLEKIKGNLFWPVLQTNSCPNSSRRGLATPTHTQEK